LSKSKLAFKTQCAPVVKEGENTGNYTFVFSSPEVDRDGDTIDQMGIDCTAFKLNPVVLWAHDYRSPPVAKVKATWLREGKLHGSIAFPPHGAYALSDTLHALVDAGFLNAVSIGFMPMETEPLEDSNGLNYKKIELMEISLVPVPSCREALLAASATGIDTSTVTDWARGVLDVPPEPNMGGIIPIFSIPIFSSEQIRQLKIIYAILAPSEISTTSGDEPVELSIVPTPPNQPTPLITRENITDAVQSALKDLARNAVKYHTGRL